MGYLKNHLIIFRLRRYLCDIGVFVQHNRRLEVIFTKVVLQ